MPFLPFFRAERFPPAFFLAPSGTDEAEEAVEDPEEADEADPVEDRSLLSLSPSPSPSPLWVATLLPSVVEADTDADGDESVADEADVPLEVPEEVVDGEEADDEVADCVEDSLCWDDAEPDDELPLLTLSRSSIPGVSDML